MKKLIKFEFHNLLRAKSLYICIIISMCFSALSVILSMLSSSLLAMEENVTDTAVSSLTGALSSGELSILLVVFISIFVCRDYAEGTIKNVVSRGYTRVQVYFAKEMVLILGGFFFLIADLLTTFITACIFFDVGTFSTKILSLLMIDVILLIAYVTLYHFFAVLFRKNGATIASGIVFPLALSLVITMLPFVFGNHKLDLSGIDVTYWVSILSEDIASVKQEIYGLLCGVAYIIVFGVASLFATRKRNL